MGAVYTIIIRKKKTKYILQYQHLFISHWCYMFRPLYWVIIRRTRIWVLVLELRLNSIWIHILFLWVLYTYISYTYMTHNRMHTIKIIEFSFCFNRLYKHYRVNKNKSIILLNDG
jgi:hypothetical protein